MRRYASVVYAVVSSCVCHQILYAGKIYQISLEITNYLLMGVVRSHDPFFKIWPTIISLESVKLGTLNVVH